MKRVNHAKREAPHPQLHQRGINLIEIMVSMAIGLFLVLGATTLYVNSRRTADVDDAIARLQETARYAMSVVEIDARSANYWGLLKSSVRVEGRANTPDALADTTPCRANYATDLNNYLEGSNNGYTFNQGAAAAVCAPSSGLASATADTVTIRRASTTVAAADNTRYQICATRAKGFLVGDGTCIAELSELHNLSVNTYYIDQNSDQAVGLPSLRRKTLIANNTWRDDEITPGVEDMQIQFGWSDTGPGSGNANAQAVRYVDPDNVPANTGQIVSVRIWLLIRAESADVTFTDTNTYQYADRANYAPADNFRRILVSRTIFLRNVLGT